MNTAASSLPQIPKFLQAEEEVGGVPGNLSARGDNDKWCQYMNINYGGGKSAALHQWGGADDPPLRLCGS
jgi:hypothetical protein